MTDLGLTRRQFCRALCLAAAAGVVKGKGRKAAGAERAAVPIRAITKGPKFHWFGYYDKLEFDPTSRYVLGMEVDFEHRSPRPDDCIAVGMVDLENDDKWIELGHSVAWNWQQGCMLQWIPGSDRHIIWNDRVSDRFVSHILNVKTAERRTIPHPVYALGPDGRTAIAPDFARLQDMRPGYGYAGCVDPYRDQLEPEESGIFRIDLESGRQELIISIADIARFGQRHPSMENAKHYFNHLLFNPDGSRFVFLHRWRSDRGKGRFFTRMITASCDGKDWYVLDPSGHTSHFIWRDPEHILAWTKPRGHEFGFYLFRDRTREFTQIGKGVMTHNGHCSYLPGGAWILNDTYPQGPDRLQHVYVYHVPSGRLVTLGRFHSPKEYTGEWRCDTHPRFSPDGRKVVIDSPHGGNGRQMYLIDLRPILDE